MSIKKFNEIYGQKDTINLILGRLQHLNEFPKFIILEGEEGTGKTTLAKLIAMSISCENRQGNGEPCYICDTCKRVTKEVIEDGHSSHNIFLYKLASAGGKDTVNEMLSTINTKSVDNAPRVFIGDEAHGLSTAGQDALLSDAEKLPPNVFLVFCTTDMYTLNKSLISRATKFRVNRLTRKEMHRLLEKEITKLHLTLDYKEIIFNLICEYSEFKPREALSIIDSMRNSTGLLSLSSLENFLGINQTDTILDIIESLNMPIHVGLTKIQELEFNINTQTVFCKCIIGIIKVLEGIPVNNIRINPRFKYPETNSQLLVFLKEITEVNTLTPARLVYAFTKAHKTYKELIENEAPDKFERELIASKSVGNKGIPRTSNKPNKIPDLKTLIGDGRNVK